MSNIMLKFTTISNNHVYINTRHITSVMPSMTGGTLIALLETSETGESVVYTVKEPLDVVLDVLSRGGYTFVEPQYKY